MIRTRWAGIVNLSSLAPLAGNRGQVNYAAAKAAINSATKALALELASRGITVNAMAPGIIATPMSEGHFDADLIERLVPMKRAGRPEEVADLVGFLYSDQASYMTGQVIRVKGGITLAWSDHQAMKREGTERPGSRLKARDWRAVAPCPPRT